MGAGDYELHDGGLALPTESDRFTVRIVNRIRPAANTELMGLFLSHQSLFTQCEAEGFRRITYFPDRPDVMARYRVILRADKARFPVLLANGNLVEHGDLPDDRHVAVWDDPFAKPSYLFALVAGNFVAHEEAIRRADGREALLQLWVEPGNLDKTSHAMESLKRAIAWDEQRFGLELDLDRFMVVASNDFNMGAMENKGLNIFNSKYVLASPTVATDSDYANIESIVGHEYFHNWTGNRVTCRDWFQLSLKEGLTVFRDQEFSSDMLGDPWSRAVKRIEDVRTLRATQFPEDAGPMAHPVRPDTYQEISNFYTATVYEKGAEVVRMLHTLVGGDGFRSGMDLYFKRHDGQAVTCDDFVAAIADANGRDLGQFKRWYSQAGTPHVRATGVYDPVKRTYELTLDQTAPATPGQATKEPFHIPFALGLIGADGRDLPLQLEGERRPGPATRLLELTQTAQRFRFIGVPERPVPSLLAWLLGASDRRIRLCGPRTADADRFGFGSVQSLGGRTAAGDDAPDAADRCHRVRARTFTRRRLRRRRARDPARRLAFARVQGAGADIAGRRLHRRAAGGGRPRGRTRRASRDDGRTGASARR